MIASRLMCLFLVSCLLICSAGAMASEAPGTIETAFHAPEEASEFEWRFPYADALFALDANQYHHELAQASIGFAVSAFRKAVDDLSRRDENVTNYLRSAGFSNIQTQQYDITPTIDTIATAIGSKAVEDGDGRFTLIAVGVSGAGYEDEWESNFSIGDGADHAGFLRAANVVVDRIKAYIGAQGISGDVRLWITGYSRAAAVSNLVAAMAHEDEGLPLTSIYAYTFATPNTTKEKKDYAFIYNVVGQFDPVPSVPFHKWGYDRHGTTLYLPAREVNPDYDARAAAPREIYSELTRQEAFWVSPEANWLVHKLCEFLADFVKDSADYAAHYQQIFIDTYGVKGSILEKLKVCAEEIMKSGDVLAELSEEKKAFWRLLSEESYETLLESIGWHGGSWHDAKELLANIMHEHFPQVYVSWIMAYDTMEETFSEDTGYKRVAVAGPVDIDILTNRASTLVAQVKNGQVTQTGEESVPVIYVGDELLITLPGCEAFALRFTARKDGTLKYMLKEQYAGYVSTRAIQFDDIPLKSGEVLVSSIDEGEATDRLESLLIDQDANVYKPTKDSLTQADPSLTDAISDLTFDGAFESNFLGWAMVAASVVLALALIGTPLGIYHHRKKRRKRDTD